MVNNFSVDLIGLYKNWANTSLFIILGKFLGYKGEAINFIPHYLIYIIYKTVKPSHLKNYKSYKV